MPPELQQWTAYAVGGLSLPFIAVLVVTAFRLDRRSSAARVADALKMAEERSRMLDEERTDHAEDRQRWRDDVAALRSDLEMERQRCDRLEARVNTMAQVMRENGWQWPG